MDAGKISGSVINTAIGTDYTVKAAEARPDRNTIAPAAQWDASCMLQISSAGYRKYEQTQKDAVSRKQAAVVSPSSVKKTDPLEDAMANLTRFTAEREQILSNPKIRTSEEIENERMDALEQVGLLQEDEPQSEITQADVAESKAGINRKLRQLSHGIRLQTFDANPVIGGAIDAIYNEARKNLTQAKQEDRILRNGLSALYRYVIRDNSLSSKDKADAINRFVTEGKQSLSKIENSLGYSLARLRSIKDIKQAQKGYADVEDGTVDDLSGQLQKLLSEEQGAEKKDYRADKDGYRENRPQEIQKKEWRIAV